MGSYPDVPKGIQVHHLIDITRLLEKYGITTLNQAAKCKGLWREPGICLKQGEHFLITKLKRYKLMSRGFVQLINEWLLTIVNDPLDTRYTKRRKQEMKEARTKRVIKLGRKKR